MREIKLRAEYLLLKAGKEIRREILLMRAEILGMLLCTGALFSGKMLILPALAGLIALLYFYFAGQLYLSGKYYYLTGEISEEPFIRFSLVLRYIRLRCLQGLWGLFWLNFFLLPSRITGLIIVRTLAVTGNIERVMLITLLSAFVILGIIGTGFYSYLRGSGCLAELLFLRCPNQSPRELLRSSCLITAERLSVIMLFRVGSFFGKRGAAGRLRRAVFISDLFSDRRFYKNYGLVRPVTFPEPF